MTPWKLRIDWTTHNAYGDPVEVDLYLMDEDYPRTLRTFDTISRAVDWALRYFTSRGFDYWCDIDMHQRMNHTYITLHPRPRKEN